MAEASIVSRTTGFGVEHYTVGIANQIPESTYKKVIKLYEEIIYSTNISELKLIIEGDLKNIERII